MNAPEMSETKKNCKFYEKTMILEGSETAVLQDNNMICSGDCPENRKMSLTSNFKLSFDANLNGCHSGCVTSILLTSDEGKFGFEANRYGVQLTADSLTGKSVGIGGVGVVSKLQKGTLETVDFEKTQTKETKETKENKIPWDLYGPGNYIDTTKAFHVNISGTWKEPNGEDCLGVTNQCYLELGLILRQNSNSIAGKVHRQGEDLKHLKHQIEIERRSGSCAFHPREGSTYWLDSCKDHFKHYTKCWNGEKLSNPACLNTINQGDLADSILSNVRITLE